PYGSATQQAEVRDKNAAAAGAPAAVAADRATFNASSSRAIQGRGDLISDLRENTIKLDDLKKEELPKDLQDLPRQQQIEKIQTISAERETLSKQVAELAKQRQAF